MIAFASFFYMFNVQMQFRPAEVSRVSCCCAVRGPGQCDSAIRQQTAASGSALCAVSGNIASSAASWWGRRRFRQPVPLRDLTVQVVPAGRQSGNAFDLARAATCSSIECS